MAVYIIDHFSQFFKVCFECGCDDLTVVTADSADAYYLKDNLLRSEAQRLKIFTEDEWRNELLKITKTNKNICSLIERDFLYKNFISNLANVEQFIPPFINTNTEKFLDNVAHLLRIGIKPNQLADKRISDLIIKFIDILSDNALMTASIADDLLLSCISNNDYVLNNHVIFYGFPPFDIPLSLINASAKACSKCDIIIYDIDCCDEFYDVVSSLEGIFGNVEYLCGDSDTNTANDVNLRIYESCIDEVKSTVESVNHILSSEIDRRIAICIDDNHLKYLPMITDSLTDFGIEFSSFVKKPKRKYRCYDLISAWCDWQKDCDVDSFCRFCAGLSVNGMLDINLCEKIFRNIKSLQNQCLFKNFNMLLEYANLEKNHSFDLFDEFIFLNEKYKFSEFIRMFLRVFNPVLPEEIKDILKKSCDRKYADKFFSKAELIDYIYGLFNADETDYIYNPQAKVVLISIDAASRQNFSDVFVLGSDSICNGEDETTSLSLTENKCSGDCINFYKTLNSRLKKQVLLSEAKYLCLNSNLTLSYSKLSHSIEGARNNDPSDLFKDFFFEKYGEYQFADKTHRQLGTPQSQECCDEFSFEKDEDIKRCIFSYRARHDRSSSINDYCFSIKDDGIINLSCKAMEYLLKNPHVGFYSTVLGCEQMPWLDNNCNKSIAIGLYAHDFLQFPTRHSEFIHMPFEEDYRKSIFSRYNQRCSELKMACLACDENMPFITHDALNRGLASALRLKRRIFEHTKSEDFFCSEFRLPECCYIKFGQNVMSVSGRIDFVLSNSEKPFSNENGQSDVTIIDFKTGGETEFTEKNIKNTLGKYNGLQLLLYGMSLESLGIKDPMIMILRQDSDDSVSAISVDYVLHELPELSEKIANVLNSGLIEKQTLGKQFRQFFLKNVPLATTDLY